MRTRTMKFLNIEHYAQYPKLLVLLCFVFNKCYGIQSGGRLYNKRENQEPTGKEITSLIVQFYGHCALECNRDHRCHTFVMYDNVNRCRLYSCTDVWNPVHTQGATSYIKGEVLKCPFLYYLCVCRKHMCQNKAYVYDNSLIV